MWRWLQQFLGGPTGRAPSAEHLQRGTAGERAARDYLGKQGWKLLAANYRVPEGEIDLVFRDREVLVFVEVKTRTDERWQRPAAAVDSQKRRRVSRAALAYLNSLGRPRVKFRFDVVEVLLPAEGPAVIRHWPNAFPLSQPYRYVAVEEREGGGGRRR
ncbi:YraN family protein [Fontisphaera persica]|uniref:YraN family protein n=1 Tax=Fontisphaera persica TaxID=2974023 RepID=UPI0024BF9582|nr:YraN family protein [Fontisphaera persica]WCJ60133.1 YraN family protein [Fontisphaera persica]